MAVLELLYKLHCFLSAENPKTSYKMPSATIQTLEQKIQSLKTKLSCEASIVLASDPKFSTLASRWSDFGGPQPGALVYVATEEDVERTVRALVQIIIQF